MIIGHHLAVHGNYPISENMGVNDYAIRFFTIGGKLGVNIFVLISGYFMVKSTFRFKKLIRLFAQLLFYSLLIFLLFLILGKVEYSNRLLLNSLFHFFKCLVVRKCIYYYILPVTLFKYSCKKLQQTPTTDFGNFSFRASMYCSKRFRVQPLIQRRLVYNPISDSGLYKIISNQNIQFQ